MSHFQVDVFTSFLFAAFAGFISPTLILTRSAAFWPSVAFGRTSLPLRPGTSHPRSARAWRSCSAGTRPRSIQRCPWQGGALLAGWAARPGVTVHGFSHRVRLILLYFSECETCKRSSCSPGRLGESQRPVLPRFGADRAPGERAGRTARVGGTPNASTSHEFSLVPPHFTK